MNGISKIHLIDQVKLNQNHYFESLLQEASHLKLLSDSEVKNIQYQIMDLLAEQLDKYTSKDSSSVRVEVAQQVIQSIFFTISFYLKGLEDVDFSITQIKENTLQDLYKEGQRQILSLFEDTKKLFQEVKASKILTKNKAYNETLDTGIQPFFDYYDSRFGAHEIPGVIDYPVTFGKAEPAGIEYMNKYLQIIYLENIFCNRFDSKSIRNVLYGYSEFYKDLLINLFEQILPNALGCVLCGKSAVQLNINQSDLIQLQQKFSDLSKSEQVILLKNALDELLVELNISDKSFLEHCDQIICDLSDRIYHGLKYNQLQSIFINFKEKHQYEIIEVADSEPMDDDLFRKVTDEIRDCRYISDKLMLITEHIHSFSDLCGILEGDCLFDEEYIQVFKTLKREKLELLLNLLPLDEEYNKEWHKYFIKYFID